MTLEEMGNYIKLLERGEYDLASKYKSSTLPNSLYKYYGLDVDKDRNKSKLDYLEKQLIYLSKPSGFNDPFEGKYLIFDEEELRKKGWDIDLVEEYYNRVIDFFNITCLSDTDEQNMPMWAYYANNHQGYCIEYQLSELQKKYIYSVNYESMRQQANSIVTRVINLFKQYQENPALSLSGQDEVTNIMLFLSITAKHVSWRHEKEYRIIAPYNDFPATASTIYIGLNCEAPYKDRLIEIGRSFSGHCNVYQMQIKRHSKTFALDKQQIV